MYPTQEPTEEEQKVAADLMRHINGNGLHPEGLVAALSHEHRTLQQHMTRMCVGWIEYLAKLEPGEYDPRNEASVMLARQIVALPFWENHKYLPYV